MNPAIRISALAAELIAAGGGPRGRCRAARSRTQSGYPPDPGPGVIAQVPDRLGRRERGVLGKATFWSFAIPLVLASLSGLAGWVINRVCGDGDDAAEANAEPVGPPVTVRRL